MWFIPTKKQIKKEFEKIKISFKKRDNKINNNSNEINKTNLKIARLEGVISMLINQKSQPVSQSLKKSHSNIETKLINRVKRNKKQFVKGEIAKLKANHSVIEMFDIIVKEKGLCSKASFYRYISSLTKSHKLILRQK